MKDFQSFENKSHLTEVSLKTMVSHAYSCHEFEKKDYQDIYVSGYLCMVVRIFYTTVKDVSIFALQ